MARYTSRDDIDWTQITAVSKGTTPLSALYQGGDKLWPGDLEGIHVEVLPAKTEYATGQNLDLQGIKIVAVYSNGTQDVTADCTFNPVDGTPLSGAGDLVVTVSYTKNGTTYTDTFTVNVVNSLESIAITTMPTQVSYPRGSRLNLAGMIVTATYSGGRTAVVTASCITDPEDGSSLMQNEGTNVTVAVSFTDHGITKSTSFVVAVTAPTISAIAVTTRPDKLEYNLGETLDLTGIVVTATFTDGTTSGVTSLCTFFPADGDTLSTRGEVHITATYNGLTASFTVQVNAVLVSIAVTTMPTKVVYAQGETFTLAGMVVTATYNDSQTAEVTAYSVPFEGERLMQEGEQTVRLSYTEGDITAHTSFLVTVGQPIIVSIQFVNAPTKQTYYPGEALDISGAQVDGIYSDDSTTDITASCSFTPADGSIRQKVGNFNLRASYVSGENTLTASIVLHVVADPSIVSIRIYEWVSRLDNFRGTNHDYSAGTATATISNLYDGDRTEADYSWTAYDDFYNSCLVEGIYEDGRVEDIRDYCTFSRRGDNEHTTFWIANYGELSDTVSCWWEGVTVCLSGDTDILMADGSTKKLKDLSIGELVMGQNGPTEIVKLHRGKFASSHTKYYFSDGTVIDETGDHRFFNATQGFWQRLRLWKIGDEGQNACGEPVRLVHKETIIEFVEQFGLWTRSHNYYANGLLSGDVQANRWLFHDATISMVTNLLAGLSDRDIAKQAGWASFMPEEGI